MDDPEPIVQESSSTTTPWGPQIPYIQSLFERADQLYKDQAGATVNTGPSANQEAARANLVGSVLPGMRGQLGDLSSAMQFGLQGALDVQNNPYLQGAIEASTRPILQNLRESVLPGIASGASLTGNLGSSRQGIAEGIASRGALDAIGDVTSRIGSDAYGQGLQTFMNTLGMFPMYQQAQLLPEQILEAVGGTQRGEQLQQDLFALNQPSIALNNFANLVRGGYGGSATGREVTPQGDGGGIGSLIGLGAQGAGMASALGFAGPWGMAAGAGLGILSGIL